MCIDTGGSYLCEVLPPSTTPTPTGRSVGLMKLKRQKAIKMFTAALMGLKSANSMHLYYALL